MFSEYFEIARHHLQSVGIAPVIQDGVPVTEAELDEVAKAIGLPIPVELRSFFLELGDGYSFSPHQDKEGFMLGRLGDYKYKVANFAEYLEDDLPSPQYAKHPPEVLAKELERRKNWFPFYNFGGGGYLFCLDLNESPAPIRYHERCYWPTDPIEHWKLSMADSLYDFVCQWSRYCFATAKGATLINVALSARGIFDWAPSRFESIFDRGTTNAGR